LPSQRSEFVHGVKRLGHNPSNKAVHAAITAELALNPPPSYVQNNAELGQ